MSPATSNLGAGFNEFGGEENRRRCSTRRRTSHSGRFASRACCAAKARSSDERPWLGVVAKPVDENDNASPLEIVDVVSGSPAVGKIENGDVLSAVGSARRRGAQYAIGPVLYDQFAKLSAGDTARLHLLRHGSTVAVTLTLGSLDDASAGAAYVPTNDLVAAL